MRGGLGCTAGESVAGGTSEGGLVSVGQKRLSENAAKGLVERHALRSRPKTCEPGSIGSDQCGSLVVTGQDGALQGRAG